MRTLRIAGACCIAPLRPCAGAIAMALLAACGSHPSAPVEGNGASVDPVEIHALSNWNMKDKIIKSDEDWKRELSAEQFRVLRGKGTERPFTGAYWDSKDEGVYICAACGLELFDSGTKFDSGTGWPSFYRPRKEGHVTSTVDKSLFVTRTEVLCARCDGHLGHVFDDGPKPTGLRYCINSAALGFEKKE